MAAIASCACGISGNIWKTWIMPSQTLSSTSTPAASAAIRQHGGVVAHGLAITGVNQKRRQAGEIGVERRDEWIKGITALAHVTLCQRQDHRSLVDRIGGGPALKTLAGRGEVSPWRHQRAGGGQRFAAVAQAQQKREHEIAAGGIADKGDVLGLEALLQHPGIGGERVVQRRGKRCSGARR